MEGEEAEKDKLWREEKWKDKSRSRRGRIKVKR